MEDFATYILKEKDYMQKMIIAYYMSQKTGIYFDKSIVLRTEITRMFLNYTSLDIDKNLVLTAMLLCNCKKVDNSQKKGKLETYAKEGAEYLSMLGFDKNFCKICEGLNRYSKNEPRKKESDILELVDQFTGLILKRAEREAFTPSEALIILKERNLKYVNNRYLDDFILFVNAMEKIYIKDVVEVPIIRKLAFLCEKEKNAKTFISALSHRYSEEIDRLMNTNIKRQSKEIFSSNSDSKENISKNNVSTKQTYEDTRRKIETAHRYTRVIHKKNAERALFSQDVANRILNHETDYKF